MKAIIVLLLLVATVSANEIAVTSIKHSEGFERTAYKDVTQHSIGYGTSTVRANKHGWTGSSISRAEADRVLRLCLKEEASFLRTRLKFDDLTPQAQAALLSLSYNSRSLIGPKLCRYIKQGQFDEAAMEIAYGHDPQNKVGLVRRRFREANLFIKGTGSKTMIDRRAQLSIGAFRAFKKHYKQVGALQ